ncbi:unnamed protein product [Phytophthora lilii]|uniref:RxLR effector protein n=1 Tax=Phytophthora lilii TaxID=2077276 RepID=A0A9W6U6N8_9STRA|nr:unnamed protein product [Phytophthora lilii]
MRQDYAALLLVVVVMFLGHWTNASLVTDTKDIERDSLGSTLNTHSVANDQSKRFLRIQGKVANPSASAEATFKNGEEREIGAAQVFGMAIKAMRAKAKLTIMLGRGFSPAKAMKKLQVTTLKDKNINKFARYYARYLAKYPKKAAKLPATPEDFIVLPKLKDWLTQKASTIRVKNALKALGVTNTKKYMEMYMKDFDDLIVAKFKEWLGERVFPQQIQGKMKEVFGFTDENYVRLYVKMWGERQARLPALANRQRI